MHKCDDDNNGGRIENVRMEIKHLTILTDRRITNVDCAVVHSSKWFNGSND